MHFSWVVAAAAAAVLIFAAQLPAKINPNYTPVQVANNSTLILELQFTSVKGDVGTANVKHVLKGKFEDKTIDFTLNKAAVAQNVAQVKGLMATADELGIMFVGVAPGGQPGPDGPVPNMAYLHIHGEWVDFV